VTKITNTSKYGNNDLPLGTPSRPLVTFAILAFNQEKYIRAAIQGAFSQTYSPLEIILSDDCSSDDTFKIMEHMTGSYRGAHLVRIRRSEINLGTALHLSAVAKISGGALIVVAAGDDISMPNRCDVLVQTWNEHGQPNGCINSAAVVFDQQTKAERTLAPRTPTIKGDTCHKILLRGELPFNSPTCAFTAGLFNKYNQLHGGSIIEDHIMAFRSLAEGNIISVTDPLVRIRRLSETAGTGYSLENPDRWNRFVLSHIISCFNQLSDLRQATVGSDLRSQLEIRLIKRIRSLSVFTVPVQKKLSFGYRIMFLIKYILINPTRTRLITRVAIAIRVSGFSSCITNKSVRGIINRFNK
jgi:glycosyltransferase involved in cell wall biosynthesis